MGGGNHWSSCTVFAQWTRKKQLKKEEKADREENKVVKIKAAVLNLFLSQAIMKVLLVFVFTLKLVLFLPPT